MLLNGESRLQRPYEMARVSDKISLFISMNNQNGNNFFRSPIRPDRIDRVRFDRWPKEKFSKYNDTYIAPEAHRSEIGFGVTFEWISNTDSDSDHLSETLRAAIEQNKEIFYVYHD